MGSIHVQTLTILLIIACAGGNEVIRRAHLSVRPDGQVGRGGSASKEVAEDGLKRSSVVRKAVSKRHQEERQPGQKWIYAIQTCAAKSYVHQLETQLSTWLKPVSRDHVIIVGGPHSDCTGNDCNVGAKKVKGKYEVLGEGTVACNENNQGQNCKEASVLYRGAGLAEKVDADWLFHVIDDAYVFLPRVQKVMEGYDPSEPVVFADVGCGGLWRYRPESKGNTLPKLKGWVEPKPSCDRVEREGGMCTGAGYIVSRGALKLLRRNHTLPSFIEHYTHSSKGRASDSTSTCLFYDRDITVRKWPPLALMAQTHPNSTAEQIAAERIKYSATKSGPHMYGLVHVNFVKKTDIPPFMEQLQEAGEREALK